jgi:recombination protein RecA
MSSAAIVRIQVEAALANRISWALTPAPRMIRPVAATGIASLDEVLRGGLPVGAITEVAGPECSGRTAFALSFLANVTSEDKVCAWVDASDAFHPESAAAAGIDLARLLWIRCGAVKPQQLSTEHVCLPDRYFAAPPAKKGLHGGGFGPHPRTEARGLSSAVGDFLGPRCAEPQHRERTRREPFEPLQLHAIERPMQHRIKPLSRIDQALRVTDLLLQAGGFSAIVLDLGSIAPELVLRVPAATWFRYRAAAERTQASILLLTQYACAKSSAELVLRMQPGEPRQDERTVFTGVNHQVEIVRERFVPTATNVIPLRKPAQAERAGRWQTRTSWAGAR